MQTESTKTNLLQTEEKTTEESGPAYPMTVSPTIASTESEEAGTVTI